MAGMFVVAQSSNKKYFFDLRAENEERILTSEEYDEKQGAVDGIASVRKNSQTDSSFKRKESARGMHYFVLVAANGEPIGTSEEYSSREAMEHGIAAVKKVAQGATVKDKS